ncbi:hypothetical protein B484DRAFT_395900 [Ochromonadaceae sp. CCMP2298]|nr:hypothetical protein B484DRAFT_395900 [Ochromonadaceae sp. CCMP2298]|mmetsp:Transcript_23938/g.51749  ORF Transcript_23938/g.51749 Transcript_23938/m.51749 type:complete len:308 (+) Transcript_23938:108-1031(+)
MLLPILLLCYLATAAAFVGGGLAQARRPLQFQLRAAKASIGSDVQSLLAANRGRVASLASVSPDVPELTLLRFALQFPIQADAESALRETLKWRRGAGRTIVESAAKAVAEATAGGGWDNEPVRAAAPYAAAINQYITTKNILTISMDEGDLMYVIRASGIDDKALMDKVSVQQFVDFLLYVKEVHSLIVNARSERTGRLCGVVFANDVTGIRAIPDKRFSQALTASSQQYEKLYPTLAGQTMILNLPFILQAFVGLFKPLFPKSVQARLVFASAPFLARLKELTPLTTDKNSLKTFLTEVRKLLQR